MKNFFRGLLLLLIMFVFSASMSEASGGQIFNLDNGIRVFIKQVKSAPVVAVNFWVKVGSVNEMPGEEGYSHLIEHMMFKGTPTYPYGTVDNEIKKMGAQQNAFTANDYTCYYLVGASRFFEKMMELQADAVFNSSFDANELAKETQVVIEELKMSLDNPSNRVVLLLMEEAFRVHPYRHPIVGYLKNLEEVTRDKLYEFYKKFYVPGNIWIVVVGDVDPQSAFEVIKKHAGNIPARPLPQQTIPEEPAQENLRERVEFAEIQHSYVRMGWKVPGINSVDRFPLFVVAQLIGGGQSSWLWRELVEAEQLAVSAGAGFYTSQFPMLFQVGGVTTSSKVRRFTEAAKKIVYRLISGEISPEELEKAKQQIIANDVFGRETAENQASDYGHFAMLADVNDADKFVASIREVNIEDIRRVAVEYFKDSALTIARLETRPPEADALPQMITLENGLKLILKENHASPLVSVSVKIGAGGLREEKREAGLANLTAHMLAKGAVGLSTEEINEKFEGMGTRFSVNASKSYVGFNLQTLSENFLPSLDLLINILEKPDFPGSELDKMKTKVGEWIKADEDDLYKFTSNALLEALFPGSPVGYSVYGKPDDIKRFKASDLKDFHKKHYVAGNMVVAIVGDFYASELKENLLAGFGRFSSSKPKELKAASFKEIKEPIEVKLQKNREQAQIIYAARTFSAADEKVPAMTVAQTILSGSMSSRLFQNLRARDSLAYSTWAYNVGMADNGYFMAAISTAAPKTATATLRLKEEIDLFREKGFSQQEFEDAKKYIIGQHALSLVDSMSQADNFTADEFFGKGFDYFKKYPSVIEATTMDQVKAVAQEYLLASGSYGLAVTTP